MSLAYSVSVDVNELPSIFPLSQQTITMVVILRSAAAEQAATQGPLTNSVSLGIPLLYHGFSFFSKSTQFSNLLSWCRGGGCASQHALRLGCFPLLGPTEHYLWQLVLSRAPCCYWFPLFYASSFLGFCGNGLVTRSGRSPRSSIFISQGSSWVVTRDSLTLF